MKPALPNLHIALTRAGMNQADLARRTGWSEAKVSRLLNGQTQEVTVAMLKELEAALGCSLAYLLDIEDVAQDDYERDMLRRSRRANPRERQAVESILPPLDDPSP